MSKQISVPNLPKDYYGGRDPTVIDFYFITDEYIRKYADVPITNESIAWILTSEVIVKEMPEHAEYGRDYTIDGFKTHLDFSSMTRYFRVFVRFTDENKLAYALLSGLKADRSYNVNLYELLERV